MRRLVTIAALSAIAGGFSAAAASEPAVQNFSGGSTFNIFYGASTGDVIGWRFQVTEPLTVTHLGVWHDVGFWGIPGIQEPKQTGIWDGSQNLLGEVTIDPGDPIKGHGTHDWFWRELSDPIDLAPGQTYTIGSMYTAFDSDDYVSGPSITSAPEVTVTGGAYPTAGSMGFVYPPLTSGTGRFGPNFKFGEPVNCPPDWNGDGVVDSDDLFDFLADWAAGNADYNGDGVTDSDDLFEFLADWANPDQFPGC